MEQEIIDYLNNAAGKKFKLVGQSAGFIRARIKDGYKIEDFKHVIDVKANQWANDPKMSQYLNPHTLFRPSNFDRYLNQQIVQKRTPDGIPREVPTTDEDAAVTGLLNSWYDGDIDDNEAIEDMASIRKRFPDMSGSNISSLAHMRRRIDARQEKEIYDF